MANHDHATACEKRNVRRCLLMLAATMANNLDRKAESKCKSYSFPEAAIVCQSNNHHYKTKKADDNGEGVLFRKIAFHVAERF